MYVENIHDQPEKACAQGRARALLPQRRLAADLPNSLLITLTSRWQQQVKANTKIVPGGAHQHLDGLHLCGGGELAARGARRLMASWHQATVASDNAAPITPAAYISSKAATPRRAYRPRQITARRRRRPGSGQCSAHGMADDYMPKRLLSSQPGDPLDGLANSAPQSTAPRDRRPASSPAANKPGDDA